MKLRNPRTPRRRRTAAARIGLVTAVAAALGVLTAGPAPAHTRLVDGTPGKGGLPAGAHTVAYRVVGEDGRPVRSDDLAFTATPGDGAGVVARSAPASATAVPKGTGPVADAEESGSGAVAWIIIGVGVLIGVGIGFAIVSRATRRHTREHGRGGPR